MSLQIGHAWVQHAIKLSRNAKYRHKQIKTIISSNEILLKVIIELDCRSQNNIRASRVNHSA